MFIISLNLKSNGKVGEWVIGMLGQSDVGLIRKLGRMLNWYKCVTYSNIYVIRRFLGSSFICKYLTSLCVVINTSPVRVSNYTIKWDINLPFFLPTGRKRNRLLGRILKHFTFCWRPYCFWNMCLVAKQLCTGSNNNLGPKWKGNIWLNGPHQKEMNQIRRNLKRI